MRERGLELRVPVLAREDARELVAAAGQAVVRAQEADAHALLLGLRPASDERVAQHQVAGHLAEELVQVLPAGDALQERGVDALRFLQVEAVEVRRVEEVALQAPDLVVHLPPFRPRVDVDLDGGLERPVALLGRLLRVGDEPLLALGEEHLGPVAGEEEGRQAPVHRAASVDLLQQLLGLALLQLEARDALGRLLLELGVVLVGEHRRVRHQEQDPIGARLQRRVVRPVDGKGDDALVEPFEVDRDRLGRLLLLRLLVLGLLLVGLRVAGLVVLRPLRRGGFLVLGGILRFPALLVALRGHRRRQVLPQDGRPDAARHGAGHARHIEPALGEAGARRGEEIQVLATAVEARRGRVAAAVGDLAALLLGHRVDEDRAQVVAELLRVGDPAAVGRPGGIQVVERRVVEVAVDLHRRGLVEIDHPQVHPLVGVRDLLAVGRPPWGIEEGWRLAQVELAHGAEAVGASHVQRVLAGLVGEPGDPLTVWRPGRIAVGDRGASRQVPDVALLRRHGQDLTVRFEEDTLAGRGKGGMQDLPGLHLLEVRTELGQVGGQCHLHPVRLPGAQIVEAQRSQLVVDDRPRTGAGGLDVEAVLVGDHLAHRGRARVVGEQRHRPRPVGKEVDRVAHPDGVLVVRALARKLGHAGIAEVGDPDRCRLSAPVALPGRLPLEVGHVGEMRPVRRVGRLVARRQRDLGREPARDGDGEELQKVAVGLARRPEQDGLAVGGPPDRHVGAGMVRQPRRLAPGHWDHVDVGIVVVGAAYVQPTAQVVGSLLF